MYFGVQVDSISEFEEPVAAIVGQGAGPFRLSAASLRRVEFDLKKICHSERKLISSLPKGIAIVGGFARGMYLGDMRDVGDIDLAIHISKIEVENCDFLHSLDKLSKFLESFGYRVVYRESAGGYSGPQRILRVSGAPFREPYNFCVARWNDEPLKTKWYRRRRRELDVLASATPEITKFFGLFDISICQFAYLGGQLYATEAALDDLAKKQFRVLRRTYPTRAEKYWFKGYAPVWNGLMAQVMRARTFDQAFGRLIRKTV